MEKELKKEFVITNGHCIATAISALSRMIPKLAWMTI